MALKLAIDVGGTFTDVVLYDDTSGAIEVHKVLSSNEDPSVGSLRGATQLLQRCGLQGTALSEFVHATTVATNAVLERKGAVTGLLTTRGFRDILEIRNENRYDIYDLCLRQPRPLVPRRHRLELDERIGADGRLELALDAAQVRELLGQLQAGGVTSVAVCLVNAHRNPVHEVLVGEVAREFPSLRVSLSHLVANEIREFERTSTTAVDAYVKPTVVNYIERLADGFEALGLKRRPALMLSNGGIGSAVKVANEYPVRMIESGPAAGAVLAAHLSRTALDGAPLVALDIGGTTAKVSLIQDGRPEITQSLEVGHLNKFSKGSGLPLQISAIELLEISGGGGSIARINELQGIAVGPDSAGASPGPASYGRGGQEPTVTDCDLALGYIDPQRFAGGEIQLNVEAARRAIDVRLAQPLGVTVERAARGVIDLINERMAGAVRVHAAEKGVDLRTFTLVPFGGNGPLHAFGVARTLGLRRIVVPSAAGVASAVGCVVADPAIDFVEPLQTTLAAADWTDLAARVARLRQAGKNALSEFADSTDEACRTSLDLRCVGQGYHVTIDLPGDLELPRDLERLSLLFRTRYQDLYGHVPPGMAIEIVNLRVAVSVPRPEQKAVRAAAPAGTEPRLGARRVVLDGEATEATVYDRMALPQSQRFEGPALVVERETTTLIGHNASFHVTPELNLVIDLH